MNNDALLPLDAVAPSNRQRLFVRYFAAILIGLVVLNLFVEFSENVTIDSFATSLAAAVLLQILLQLTIALSTGSRYFSKRDPGASCVSFGSSLRAWCSSARNL